MMLQRKALLIVAIVAIFALCRCSDGGDSADIDANTGTDGDTDSDTDSDTDTDTDTDTGTGDSIEVSWVWLSPGDFLQGSAANTGGENNERPEHTVTISYWFALMKNETTVAEYRACVDASACTAPAYGMDCNWGVSGKEDYPTNCVTYFQAKEFCEWIGGRMPSESEWEYAARSCGKDNNFPWGEAEPTCDLAVMSETTDSDENGWGCGTGGTLPVCSKPEGNTEQGLCDMAGNVREWIADEYFNDYNGGAPTDGSAWYPDIDGTKVARDGYYRINGGVVQQPMRTRARNSSGAIAYPPTIGFRCALPGGEDPPTDAGVRNSSDK